MKEKIKNYIKPIVIIVISIFVTFAMNMNMDYNTAINYSFTGNSIFWVILFIMTYWLLKKVIEIKNKRLYICCAILAVIFASFEVIGNSIDTYLNLDGILANNIAVCKSIIKWLGYAIIIFTILAEIYSILDKKEFFKGGCKWFTNNKRTFFLTWAIIFVAWIPYFLNYYPGIISMDSMSQIMQSLSLKNLSNHHPILHTVFIGICMNIGKSLGNYNIGVAIYSLIQMLITSAIFSFTIYYMSKRNINIKIRIFTLLFYAFYPVNALYSITMWKDILFAGAMLIFTIMMTEIATNREHFLKSKLKNVLIVISMILVILFRNNGLYVVILTIPFMFIFARKHYKKLITITVIVLAFYGLWKGPIFAIFDIDEGSVREALSIPLQQFARMSKNENLTDDERWRIYKYLPVDNLGELYYPTISDQVKNNFDNEAFANDKIGFVKLWIKLCLKYPRSAVEAFLCNNYGYWYPETVNWVVAREIYQSNLESEQALDLKTTPIIKIESLEKYNTILDRRDLPLNSMIYSIGFIFWVVMAMLMYAIYKKEYKLILIYIPVIVLWGTCLASPVFGEFRYIYSMFTCLPILIGIHFREKDKKESN